MPLRTIDSQVNDTMQLWLSKGQLKLTTPNAIYSYGMHYRSFAHAFQRLDIGGRQDISHVLVLGWGIGSIGTLLANQKGLTRITAIEHDQALVELYNKELRPAVGPEIDLHCMDALEFVRNNEAQYDLICSDVFVDNTTPQGILTASYLQGLESLRSDSGLVLLSKLHMTSTDQRENDALEKTLSSTVHSFSKLVTVGNRVYFWGIVD